MYLLLYSHKHDPVVKAIIEHDQYNDWLCISINDLLNKVIIFDKIENGNISINWTLPNGNIIKNSDQIKLVSRVISVEAELFSDYHPDDREYAQNEFYAYLAFAINSFKRRLNDVTAYGLSGSNFPLVLQWEKNKNLLRSLNISTPNYYLGDIEFSNNFLDDKETIVSNIFNYYHWKVITEEEKSKIVGHQFLIEKPAGKPICVLYSSGIVTLQPDHELSKDIQARLVNASKEICNNLETNIAELLFFVSDSNVTFAMSSSNLKSMQLYFNDWKSDLLKGITSYFK